MRACARSIDRSDDISASRETNQRRQNHSSDHRTTPLMTRSEGTLNYRLVFILANIHAATTPEYPAQRLGRAFNHKVKV
jgi:hypothetical protein